MALLRTLDDAFVTNGSIGPDILVLVAVVVCEKEGERRQEHCPRCKNKKRVN